MSHKKGIEAWREEFKRERNGRKPEVYSYQPNSEIEIPPYLDRQNKPTTAISPVSPDASHSFVIDKHDQAEFLGLLPKLEDYQCEFLYQYEDGNDSFTSSPIKNKTPQSTSGAGLPNSNSTSLVILDLNQKSVLEDTRHHLAEFSGKNLNLCLIPGDDFLWNTGYVRGIQKYNKSLPDKTKIADPVSIYIPLHSIPAAENERQLIPLTNRILSFMVCGLHHCMWDLRDWKDWQKKHLHLLLNIPEILTRESEILSNGDVVRGSDFLESLSDKVLRAVS